MSSRKVLVFVFSIQLAVIGLILLESMGFDLGVIVIPTMFAYLFIVPGTLLIKIIRIRAGLLESLLLSVGLSLLVIMAVGITINVVYPQVGIQPFSLMPIAVTYTVLTIVLASLYWRASRGDEDVVHIIRFPPIAPFLFMLPLFAIVGVGILQKSGTNLSLLVLMVIISLIPLLVAFKKIPERAYPIAIWTATLSLVLYNSLFGQFVRPTDNVYEMDLLSNVLANGVWDMSIPSGINAMPGVMVVVPTFQLLSGLDLIGIYRFVVPLLYSIVPVTLFIAFSKRFDPTTAFFSTFFFISIFEFFTWDALTMKMVSSGIFLAIMVFLMVNKTMAVSLRWLLLIMFSLGLVTSHYGTSYIMLLAFCSSLVLFAFLRLIGSNVRFELLRLPYILVYLTICMTWYSLVANGSTLNNFVLTINHLIGSISTEFISFNSTGAQLLYGEFSLDLQILKGIFILIFLFMAIGVISTLWSIVIKKQPVDDFTIIGMVLVPFIFIPYVFNVGQYEGGRAWIIPCNLAAPFFVIGCSYLSTQKRIWRKKAVSAQKVVGVTLCIFLLFNTGAAAEIIWQHNLGASIYISAPRINDSGTLGEKEYLDRVTLDSVTVHSGAWLANFQNRFGDIYVDENAQLELVYVHLTRSTAEYGTRDVHGISREMNTTTGDYILLSSFNSRNGVIKCSDRYVVQYMAVDSISNTTSTMDKVYSNGLSLIYAQ